MKSKIMILALLAFTASAAAQTVDLNATFQTKYDGQQLQGQAFNLNNVLPGDKGGWLVEFETNASTNVYVTLNKTEEGENGCNEPEAEAEGGDCGVNGELDELLEFQAWEDDGDFQVGNSQTVGITDDWVTIQNGGLQSIFSSDDTHYVAITWELPLETGNAAQTDFVKYDLYFTTEYTESDDGNDGGNDDGDGNGGDDDSNDDDSTNGDNQNNNPDNSVTGSSTGGGSGSGGLLILTVENSTDPLEAVEAVARGPQDRGLYIERDGISDEDGEVRINLPSGEYLVEILRDGYISESVEVTISDSSRTLETVQLDSVPEDDSGSINTTNETLEQPGNDTDDGDAADTPTGGFFAEAPGAEDLALALFLLLLIILLILKRSKESEDSS